MALVRAQWAGLLALFLVIAGGTAYAADTIGSADVIDNSLLSADLKNNQAVRSADVADGTLNDDDIAQGTFVNFTGSIGTVPAQSCAERDVFGVNAQGDHLILTPDYNTENPHLVYSAESHDFDGNMTIQVCNPTTDAINDGSTKFNLLVINAQ
jgi:hypothetical protein